MGRVLSSSTSLNAQRGGKGDRARLHLGPWVIAPPMVGGLVVGPMARYGSATLRGKTRSSGCRSIGCGGRCRVRQHRPSPPGSALVAGTAAGPSQFLSWSIALGSGTSGGTLAPLFTIGGALGAALGGGVAVLLPYAGVDPRLAALAGMAALLDVVVGVLTRSDILRATSESGGQFVAGCRARARSQGEKTRLNLRTRS